MRGKGYRILNPKSCTIKKYVTYVAESTVLRNPKQVKCAEKSKQENAEIYFSVLTANQGETAEFFSEDVAHPVGESAELAQSETVTEIAGRQSARSNKGILPQQYGICANVEQVKEPLNLTERVRKKEMDRCNE